MCSPRSAPVSSLTHVRGDSTGEKYGGDYARLTDLARMTLECSSFRAAHATLDALAADKGFEVLLIKDRLMTAFDAQPTGGYRDMLLNLRCIATEHICEVQITLVPILRVKQAGGHSTVRRSPPSTPSPPRLLIVLCGLRQYAVARLLKLNERETYRFEGALSAKCSRVRSGVVRELVCAGKGTGASQHHGALLDAVRAPTCALQELSLRQADWPSGCPMSELLEAIRAGGSRLAKLGLASTTMGGELPPGVFEGLESLEHLSLRYTGLQGQLPPSLCRLTRVRNVYLWGNALKGQIPEEIGLCTQLQELELQKNQLIGKIPASLGQCIQLKKLILSENQLTGEIPASLGRCVQLEKLILSDNQLTGEIPASLGKCVKLQVLQLKANQLTGGLPDSLKALADSNLSVEL